MYRTHTCGELTTSHIAHTVTLAWWVANRRNHGGLIFIDIRDRYGITQIVFDPEKNQEAWKIADSLRSEYVIQIQWMVRARPEGQMNEKIITGMIEVIADSLHILSKSNPLPFEVSDFTDANEEIRLKHRYLDLRRKSVFDKIAFRAKMNHFARNWFTSRDFIEVQTPIFTVSSPEGARDYLIPSRIHPWKFYALPQAPQQYKQLLMIGGMDKYFQIAPCFRDEDPRADRHSCEFYQLDCEMSFVEQDDIFNVAEPFVRDLVETLTDKKIVHGFSGIDNLILKSRSLITDADTLSLAYEVTSLNFVRLTHRQAIDLFWSDKPDIRFDMHFEDVSQDFRESGFSLFANTVANGGVVKAMKLEGKILSRTEIDVLTEIAKTHGAGWLAYILYESDGPKSPILKFFSGGELLALEAKLSPHVWDMIFFWAWEYRTTCKVLGQVRIACRDRFSLVHDTEIGFSWVTDFPMYEKKDDGTYDFEHNPFSMPHGGVHAFDGNPDPWTIYGCQYDLACNGYEILSGSIRNHDVEALIKAFSIVGKGEEIVRARFGAMYTAFQYGAPPHGGFAFWFDRLLMILMDETNIREIYAFPKSGKAEDTMMNAPATVDDIQLRELNIQISEK